MTIDIPTVVTAGAIVALVGWAIRTTVIDAIKELRASSERQGRRIGRLVRRVDRLYERQRVNTAALGVPITDDDDQDDSGPKDIP